MWRFWKRELISTSAATSSRYRTCYALLYSSRAASTYNPAHPNPPYITKTKSEHIQPKTVPMKKGYGCVLCRNGLDNFGYKDVLILQQFLNPKGHLLNKRETGVCQKMQDRLRSTIRRSMQYGYLPKTPYSKDSP